MAWSGLMTCRMDGRVQRVAVTPHGPTWGSAVPPGELPKGGEQEGKAVVVAACRSGKPMARWRREKRPSTESTKTKGRGDAALRLTGHSYTGRGEIVSAADLSPHCVAHLGFSCGLGCSWQGSNSMRAQLRCRGSRICPRRFTLGQGGEMGRGRARRRKRR